MTPPTPTIRVQSHDFDLQSEIDALTSGRTDIGAVVSFVGLQSEIDALTSGRTDIGAVVSFVGLCRGEQNTLSALELEHYPGMAEAEMQRIAALAIERFNLMGLTAVHRYGKIAPGENIVLVLAASPHRQAAFDGANFVMDFLKTSAPFWKKEHGKDGKARDWVAAKDADDSARDKWA